MKKILFVFPDMSQGGTPYLLQLLSKELQNYYDCRLAVFNNIQQYTFHGTIYDLKAPTTGNPILILYYIFKRIFLLQRIVKRDKIDIIFSHALIASFISVLVKKYFRLKNPLILEFHTPIEMGVKDMGLAGYISKKIIIKNRKYINKIVCVSEGLREEVHNLGFPYEIIEKIHNPVDIGLVQKSIKSEPEADMAVLVGKSRPVIMSAGRLARAKNYFLLLDAFDIVRKKIDASLIIIGDGSLRSELIAKAESLGIAQYVMFPGWKDNPFNWIAHADVFVLSSSWEAFGNVIIEAFVCNTPVVSTDCPVGPREIITHGVDGLLANAEDKNDLAGKILLLLSDKKLYNALKKNGRKRADDFKIENQAKNYIKVLDPFLN